MTTTHSSASESGELNLDHLEALPELPLTAYNAYSDGSEPLWTKDQMRDYARAALANQPAPTVPADTFDDLRRKFVASITAATSLGENAVWGLARILMADATAALAHQPAQEQAEPVARWKECVWCAGEGTIRSDEDDPSSEDECERCRGDGRVPAAQQEPVAAPQQANDHR